jgi:hypothetical protein
LREHLDMIYDSRRTEHLRTVDMFVFDFVATVGFVFAKLSCKCLQRSALSRTSPSTMPSIANQTRCAPACICYLWHILPPFCGA